MEPDNKIWNYIKEHALNDATFYHVYKAVRADVLSPEQGVIELLAALKKDRDSLTTMHLRHMKTCTQPVMYAGPSKN